MAHAQRPASRFFAAFYQWSRHTQRPSPCAPSPRYIRLPRQPAIAASLRTYHATNWRLNKGQSTHGFVQELESMATAGEENNQASDQFPPRSNDLTQLKEDVRSLMRMVPASVAVVTVSHVDPETEESVPMGIAVSSLNTVTLDPPTVSFNIKEPSRTLNAIRDAHGSFRVHFLASDSEGLQIIEHFCRGNHPDAYRERLKNLHVEFPPAQDGPNIIAASAPRLRSSGVRAAFECTLTHELPVADHVILVAHIKSIETGDVRIPTMAYANGSYQRLDKEGLIKRH
ncbi:uncharacterized protein M421DRAFT_4784 [Didymella exigua CBS 183.55]|uniref:Flavin reductase like domain-containing protein n=1 Tax=Didymella exigua CBS 183.55 TaxID=1150837 RepID=A0A6A5RME7_9PLEO|nr:uncharacterized protein M421DRAFT_4784 [Didymella exigua CBS 183.55]KAF1928962.1 hypothetical protein M421DRAFT_4784 [Didymella exigua CBS 183.55]